MLGLRACKDSQGAAALAYCRADSGLLEEGWWLNRKRLTRLGPMRACASLCGGVSANGWAGRRCREPV